LKLISLVFEMDERPVCFMLYKRSAHVEGNFLLCKNKRDNVVWDEIIDTKKPSH